MYYGSKFDKKVPLLAIYNLLVADILPKFQLFGASK